MTTSFSDNTLNPLLSMVVIVACGLSMVVVVKAASCLRFCSSSLCVCEEAFNFPSWSGGPCLDYRAWAFCGAIRRVKKYLVMIRLLLFSFYSSTRRKQHDMTWKGYRCSLALMIACFFLNSISSGTVLCPYLGWVGKWPRYWWGLDMNQSEGWEDHQQI